MNLQLFGTTIFDMVTAPEQAAYWNSQEQYRTPFLGEELFPAEKQLGTEIKWVKGASGAPKFLKPAGVDTPAIPRGRKEFDQVLTKLGFFKESLYVDEDLRQQLNLVLASGNKVMIDTIMNQIFDDNNKLIEGARVTREIIRMQLLFGGKAKIEGNGTSYELDYGFNDKHQGYASVSWSDPKATPIDDIEKALNKIETDTGERPSRAVLSLKTFNQLKKIEEIKHSLTPVGREQAFVSKANILNYLETELGVKFAVYNKLYENSEGAATPFVPENKIAFIPGSPIGKTVFATTPEESDLMTGASDAQVAIVDTGVAVTTMKKSDPVQVETKASMNSLPTFQEIEKVFVLNTVAKP